MTVESTVFTVPYFLRAALTPTYVITSYVHLRHALGTRHFQFDSIFILADVDVRCDFATAQVYLVDGSGPVNHLFARFVQIKMEVAASKPIPLVGFQRESLRPEINSTSAPDTRGNLEQRGLYSLQKPQRIT